MARLVGKIRVSNDDEPSIILEEEDVRISEAHIANCLAVNVISSKAVNKEMFKRKIGQILQASKPSGHNLWGTIFSC